MGIFTWLEALFYGKDEAHAAGVLTCMPDDAARGRRELERIARQSQVKLTIRNEDRSPQGYTRIHWHVSARKRSVQIFTQVLSVSPAFDNVEFHGRKLPDDLVD